MYIYVCMHTRESSIVAQMIPTILTMPYWLSDMDPSTVKIIGSWRTHGAQSGVSMDMFTLSEVVETLGVFVESTLSHPIQWQKQVLIRVSCDLFDNLIVLNPGRLLCLSLCNGLARALILLHEKLVSFPLFGWQCTTKDWSSFMGTMQCTNSISIMSWFLGICQNQDLISSHGM